MLRKQTAQVKRKRNAKIDILYRVEGAFDKVTTEQRLEREVSDQADMRGKEVEEWEDLIYISKDSWKLKQEI